MQKTEILIATQQNHYDHKTAACFRRGNSVERQEGAAVRIICKIVKKKTKTKNNKVNSFKFLTKKVKEVAKSSMNLATAVANSGNKSTNFNKMAAREVRGEKKNLDESSHCRGRAVLSE